MSNSGKPASSKHSLENLDELPPRFLKPLIEKSKKHTKRSLAAARFQYPDPEQFEQLVEDGQAQYDDTSDGFTFPSDSTNIISPVEPSEFSSSRSKRRRTQKQKLGTPRRGSGGRRKPSGGGGSTPKLMDPKVVLAAVKQFFTTLPYASNAGNVQIGEFNGEFLDDSKYRYYADSYQEMLTHFHAILLSEIDPNIAPEIAKIPGYTFFPSVANTRHQAVGIVVNTDRLEVVDGPIIYNSIATVQGIPDLRPALRLDLRDKVTDVRFSLVVLHLKSMRGGPAVTGVVRRKQFTLLAQDLGTKFEGIVGGDLNFIIDDPTVTDSDPLKAAGFSLVAPGDHQPTHSGGARLDGFFHRGLSMGVDFYRVFAVFSQIGRTWSDHAPTKVEILVSSPKSNQDTTGGGTTAPTAGTDDAEDDTPPISFRRPKPLPRSQR